MDRRDPTQGIRDALPGVPSEAPLGGASQRLVIALALSLAAHAALVWSVRPAAAGVQGVTGQALHARIEVAAASSAGQPGATSAAGAPLADPLRPAVAGAAPTGSSPDPQSASQPGPGLASPVVRESQAAADPRPGTPPPAREPGIPAPPPTAIGDSAAAGRDGLVRLPAAPGYLPLSALDTPPRPLDPVRLEYPARAAAERLAGRVTLQLLISASGAADSVRVVAARPEGHFDEAALAAFRAMRFEPGRKDGRAVASRVRITVAFEPGSPAAP